MCNVILQVIQAIAPRYTGREKFQFGVYKNKKIPGDCSPQELMLLCRKLRAAGIHDAFLLCSRNRTCYLKGDEVYFQTSAADLSRDKQSYGYYRDASAASVLYSLSHDTTPEECLHHLAATKFIAAEADSYIDSNYCPSLVEQTLPGLDSQISCEGL